MIAQFLALNDALNVCITLLQLRTSWSVGPVNFLTNLTMLSCTEIIKHKGKFVELAASMWLERYEANPIAGLNELLVVLFEVCC